MDAIGISTSVECADLSRTSSTFTGGPMARVTQRTILHTIETAGPGGAETVVLSLATRLNPQRFRSIALLPTNSWLAKKLRENGVRTYSAEDRAWYEFQLPRALAKVIRDESVALVHSHLPDQNFYSCMAGRMMRCKT